MIALFSVTQVNLVYRQATKPQILALRVVTTDGKEEKVTLLKQQTLAVEEFLYA